MKKKDQTEVFYLKLLANRLRGTDGELRAAGEPMLASRMSSIFNEINIIIEKANGNTK